MQGTVIGKIRSSGGGLAVSLHKHYHKAVKWQGHKNVIELLNIPEDMQLEGTTIYFKSRIATTEEQGIITADGEESLKLVLYGKNFSIDACP
ncbi:hypothetical protein SAMN05216474_0039 [Lishizhenia tianjinensis]|uniref:Uncharacterized protein n=2 Tax=Lishizhenia tianjinensis TaxID=477690 RepID=A0A1I6X9T8_9FLAO|nr:hypothetical protein SAMN05216474_0039 [Lishizhenia tianjinensis]